MQTAPPAMQVQPGTSIQKAPRLPRAQRDERRRARETRQEAKFTEHMRRNALIMRAPPLQPVSKQH